MSRTAFTAWYDEVLPHVPGCSAALALRAIRNAAIEFCDRSWVWRYEHDPLPIDADVADYELEPPNGTVVAKIMFAWLDGKDIDPMTPQQLHDLYPDWRKQTGTPKFVTQRKPSEILLVPKPLAASTGEGFAAEVALKPSRSATDISTDIHEKYMEGIAAGALARLLAMEKKPWTDTGMAGARLALFEASVGKAKVDAMKGHVRSRVRVRPSFL